ncbi:HGxxPAAW family protein [Streptomyces sp. NPDC005962]|uniref:HGxxPAAW family protein n=1 Tax=Streptomyces sp. NPDC005962 TaxID=3154466 RepID=UPI0033C25CD6
MSNAHGHTPAAWTGVVIVVIGSCVAGAFTVLANPLGFWAGMVIAGLGGFVTLGMRAAGLGAPKAKPLRMVGEKQIQTQE